MEHPDRKKYGHQKIYVVQVRKYVYLIPFVVDEDGNVFLKTIIPSRKAKQKYIGDDYEK